MEEKTKKHLILKDYRETGFERTLNQVQEKPHLPMLPLIHKADSVFDPKRMKPTALGYFAAGFIPAVPCKFLGEKLVYTFIGRPAYRELKTPVCFILKPASELLQNVFLFDTGAYYYDRYRKIIDEGLGIDLFRIPAKQDYIVRFIEYYYGNNRNYYFSHSKNINEFALRESEEEFAYLMLEHIRSFNALEFDARCRTLENILRTPISLDNYMEGIILPESLKKNELVRLFFETRNQKFDMMYYNDLHDFTTPKARNYAIDIILTRYYEEKGYMAHES